MTVWQLYPNHIWLAGGHHTIALLVMSLPERCVLGATIVREPQDAAALMTRLLDAHGCPSMLRSIWDPVFEDLNAAIRAAVRQSGCADPVGQLDPDDFVWAVETGNTATQAIQGANPKTVDDVVTALNLWRQGPARTSAARDAGQRSGSLTIDAHPCEGPGSGPQDVLPDDRAWGSRTQPPDAP